MADGVRDEHSIPEASPKGKKKAYVRPSLRRLGSVRELTANGASTGTDGLGMMPM
jgi:hypothetical protein